MLIDSFHWDLGFHLMYLRIRFLIEIDQISTHFKMVAPEVRATTTTITITARKCEGSNALHFSIFPSLAVPNPCPLLPHNQRAAVSVCSLPRPVETDTLSNPGPAKTTVHKWRPNKRRRAFNSPHWHVKREESLIQDGSSPLSPLILRVHTQVRFLKQYWELPT